MVLSTCLRLLQWMVLLSVTENVMCEMYDPPRIEQLDELIRHKGGTLNITCTGEMPLSWSYPENAQQAPGISQRLVVTENDAVMGEVYMSTLVVSELMYADTGEFVCMYTDKSISHLVSGSPQDTLYLYVKDPDNLFAPHSTSPNPLFLAIIHGQPAVVPCRVTNPKADVSFLSMSGKAVELDDSFTYNPKKGFQIFFPNVFFGGTFRCHAQFNQSDQDILVVSKYLPNVKPPTPTIEMDNDRISTGETLLVQCFVLVQQGNFISLKWTFPADESSSRVEISEAMRKPHESAGYSYDKIQVNLTVNGVKLSDTGEYMCTAQSADKQTAKSHRHITVLDLNYVRLTEETAVVEVLRDQDTEATFIVSVDAHPEPRLTWYFEEKAIDLTNTEKYDYLYNEEKRASLTIKNPGPEDAGSYQLNGVIPGQESIQDKAQVHLYVKEPPIVKMVVPAGHPFYEAKVYTMLSCEVHGFPVPSIYWQWYSCVQLGCPVREWEQHTESKNMPQITHSGHWSNLTVSAHESGYFRCVGHNDVGQDEVEKPFYVTEIAGGFGIANISSGGRRVAIEGDDVVLECVAQKYVYGPPQFYLRRSEGDVLLTNDNTTHALTQTETEHSHKQSLLLMNVKRISNTNVYICKTTADDGRQIPAQVSIVVQAATPPTFSQPLDGMIYLEPDSTNPLVCKADGRPDPSYSWFEDGAPLNESETAWLSEGNRVLTLHTKEEVEHIYTCQASNRAGAINSSVHVIVTVGGPASVGPAKSEKLNKAQIIVIAVVVLSLLVVIVIVALIARKCFPPKNLQIEQYLIPTENFAFNPDIPLDEQTEVLGYDPKWEFPREKLEFGIMLGQGAFGKVMKAEADGIDGTDRKIPVAVKMVKDYTDREQVKALVSELKVLIHIGQHLNILNVLGAVTKDSDRGIFYVIVEFCQYGSLRSFMLKKRGDFIDTMDDYKKQKVMDKRQEAEAGASSTLHYLHSPADSSSADSTSGTSSTPPLTTKDLVCYAFQIARGMEYLSSRKYIHRDLAARNILLAADNVVKICDFGLAKDCYKYGSAYKKKSSTPVPYRWMAVESLTHLIFTTKSDVWSYGILLWEIFTMGGTPYPAIDIDQRFIETIKSGYRMQKPKYSPESVYDMMNQCWDADPDNRPSFTDLAQFFGDLLQDSVREHYVDLSGMYPMKGGDTPSVNIEPNGYLKMRGSEYTPMSPSARGAAATVGFHSDLQQDIPTAEGEDDDDPVVTLDSAADTVHYTTPQFPPQSVDYLVPQPHKSLETVAEEDEEEQEEQPLLQKHTPSPPRQPAGVQPTGPSRSAAALPNGRNGGACAIDMSRATDDVDGHGDPFSERNAPNGDVQLRQKAPKPPPKYDKMNSQSEPEEYSAPPTYSVVMTGYKPTEENC